MNLNEQYRLCNCSFKVKFGNSNISTENRFNPSKKKGCKGEILAQNLQRAGFVACSRLLKRRAKERARGRKRRGWGREKEGKKRSL